MADLFRKTVCGTVPMCPGSNYRAFLNAVLQTVLGKRSCNTTRAKRYKFILVVSNHCDIQIYIYIYTQMKSICVCISAKKNTECLSKENLFPVS